MRHNNPEFTSLQSEKRRERKFVSTPLDTVTKAIKSTTESDVVKMIAQQAFEDALVNKYCILNQRSFAHCLNSHLDAILIGILEGIKMCLDDTALNQPLIDDVNSVIHELKSTQRSNSLLQKSFAGQSAVRMKNETITSLQEETTHHIQPYMRQVFTQYNNVEQARTLIPVIIDACFV